MDIGIHLQLKLPVWHTTFYLVGILGLKILQAVVRPLGTQSVALLSNFIKPLSKRLNFGIMLASQNYISRKYNSNLLWYETLPNGEVSWF